MKASMSRRAALRTAGGAGLAGVTAAGTAPAQQYDAKQGTLKTRLSIPKAASPKVADLGDLSRTNISPDGQAATMLFGAEMQLELSGRVAGPFASLVAGLIFPVSTQSPSDENFRGFHADVRGHLNKTSATRVLLTFDLGGTLGIIEFPYGAEVNDDFHRSFFSYPYVELKMTPEGKPEGFVTPPPHYAVMVNMIIQRRGADDEAVVSLDSFDLEIVDGVAGPRPEPTPEAGKPRAAARKRG